MKVLALGLAMSVLAAGAAYAEGDAAAGANVFKKCASCHAVGEGAKNKVGPELNELIGRTAGTAPEFKYSQAMIDAGAGGLVWTAETLHQFLSKPRDFVKGTKMTFPGLKEQADIDNVVAYLATFSPAADAAAAPAAQ
ncbi:MAG: transporter [Devosia sp.]|uniref:c-type cytochrome n=1 Tax=Devosia sp. TaxID=1871048 RepID=UPI002619293B|nr:cytochrome c family protein [Devosia sp.]MDB5539212.1 transporter [Devosia sp.]